MNILIDINHPAHVHLLREAIKSLSMKGHKVFVTTKNIQIVKDLLKKYGIEFIELGNKKDSLVLKGIYQLKYNWRILRLIRKNKIDIGVGSSLTLAQASKLSKIKSIILDDDDDKVQPLITKFAHPFCDVLLSPDALKGKRKKRGTIYYPGYHELAYLHPNRFTPDPEILNEIKIKNGDTFFVMRFNAFKAHHDTGVKGLNVRQKKELIKILSPHGKIFITTEREIEPELKKYQLNISPEKIHSLLYYAKLFLGDSQTMTTEAAILGTPALKCNSLSGELSVPNEIENRFDLSFSYKTEQFNKMKDKLKDLLNDQELEKNWKIKRKKLLSEKIDVTEFLTWFIENYPHSFNKTNEYQFTQNQFNINSLRNRKDYFETLYSNEEKNLKIKKTIKQKGNSDLKKLNILVDIGHPAHVHLLRNFIDIMRKKDHRILITVKNITSAKELLQKYNFDYIDIGTKAYSIRDKFFKQLHFNKLLFRIVKKENIEIGIGTSITLAHVSKITGMKSIILDDDDDEVQPLITKFGHPFSDFVLSPDVLEGKRKKRQTLYYPGYHELAYLHPNHFTPDPKVIKDVGLKDREKFFILRFNAFKAHHDVGVKGLSLEKKRKIIDLLKDKGKIFITTEKKIDPEFKRYQLKVSPEKIHSLIYYSTMLIGDSQTMTSEAAVLGTPSLRCNSLVGKISYLEEEENRYDLTYGFRPDQFEDMLLKINELLSISNLKKLWAIKRDKMLADKIDVTAFLVWYVENFPESVKIMKENPEYQERFK